MKFHKESEEDTNIKRKFRYHTNLKMTFIINSLAGEVIFSKKFTSHQNKISNQAGKYAFRHTSDGDDDT